MKKGGTLHWIVYGEELYTGFYLWCVSSGTDCLFGFYSLHIASELRVLAHHFRNLKSSEDYKKNLKECIRRHLMIQESMPVLEKMYGFLSVWLAITCQISLCSLIFQFSHVIRCTLEKW